MALKAYGDDYGNRYAQVYTSETPRVDALATLAAETTVRGLKAFETGTVVGSATLSGAELGRDSQTGTFTATARFDGTGVQRALENGSLAATGTLTVDEFVRVFETGNTIGVGTPAVDEFVRVFEAGEFQITGAPSVLDVAKSIQTGSFSATAELRFTPLVVTDSDDPVEAFRTIFAGIKRQNFRLPKPDVFAMWDVDPQQRLKKPDPALYVWSPTTGAIERFSADGDLHTDTRTVEIMVVTLDESQTHRYTEDIIDILKRYTDDNADLTIYEDVGPTTVEDNREDNIYGKSDHYIMSVELETQRLRDGRA